MSKYVKKNALRHIVRRLVSVSMTNQMKRGGIITQLNSMRIASIILYINELLGI